MRQGAPRAVGRADSLCDSRFYAVAVTEPRTSGRLLVIAAIVTLALNLRPAVNAVGVVMPELRAAIGLSGGAAGLLLALPTLSFGVLGIFAPAIAARIGSHRTVLVAVVALIVGQLVRSALTGTVALFAGSGLALAGLAIANVLLPGLVRLHFPRSIGPMTALYTTLLTIGATAASGATLPLERGLGGDWRTGLGMWTAVAAITLVPWFALSVTWGRPPASATAHRVRVGAVARTRVGWAMALYFGLQSLQAYVMFGWLPEILTDAGLTDTTAALQVALIAGVGIPIAAVAPAVLARLRDPRLLVVALTVCYLAGYLGLLLAPSSVTWLWSMLIGVGGGSFPVALTLIALRSRTPAGTTALSAFAQSFGYLIASIGPVAIGLIHDWTGGWTGPLLVLCGVLVVHLTAGLAAAKQRFLEDELPAAGATGETAAPDRAGGA